MMGTNLIHESKHANIEKLITLGTICSYPKFSPVPFNEENIWDGYPEEVKQVIAIMMFNMGRTRLSKFKKHNSALMCGDWKTAAVEGRDSRWYKQVTNRAERLMSRLENI